MEKDNKAPFQSCGDAVNKLEEIQGNIGLLGQDSIVKNTKMFDQNKDSKKSEENMATIKRLDKKATCTSCMIMKHCRNIKCQILNTKCHNAAKKCHNLTKKCHAMTASRYGNIQKSQRQSVGYVKVGFLRFENLFHSIPFYSDLSDL